jgi:hypothetical protein
MAHEENCVMMNFTAGILHRMGGTCDKHGGWERCLRGFGWEAGR